MPGTRTGYGNGEAALDGAWLPVRASELLGRQVSEAFAHVGRVGLLVLEVFRALPEWRQWLPRTLVKCEAVGYGSIFIVLLTAGFAGAVTSLQAGYQFTGSVPLYMMGAIVTQSIILELGPVLTALVLAGRIGALGQLMNDTLLVGELRRTNTALGDLLLDLREDPGRYFRLRF